jgi:plasmid stabilization system protein ParE
MRLHWSDIAEADLDDIYDYICPTTPSCSSSGSSRPPTSWKIIRAVGGAG